MYNCINIMSILSVGRCPDVKPGISDAADCCPWTQEVDLTGGIVAEDGGDQVNAEVWSGCLLLGLNGERENINPMLAQIHITIISTIAVLSELLLCFDDMGGVAGEGWVWVVLVRPPAGSLSAAPKGDADSDPGELGIEV